ncbi:MAG: CoA pyrophosphatase [Alphaproteobacteria bacterium]
MQTDLGAFSTPDFRQRVSRRALPLPDAADASLPHAPLPSAILKGDHDLNPDLPTACMPDEHLCPAAVLVPVADRGTHMSVILTQRSPDMPAHAGQIAFPGGKKASGDASAIDTALRETHEEIGMASEFITPLGRLDPYRTGSGFQVVPVLAIVREGYTLTLDEREVVDVFEVPLEFLMTKANYQRHEKEMHGKVRYYYAIPYKSYYIWGATAGILRSMYERLYAE